MLARKATVYRLVMLQQGQSGRRYWSILRRGGRSSSGRDSGDPSSPTTPPPPPPPPSVVMNPFSSSCLLNGLGNRQTDRQIEFIKRSVVAKSLQRKFVLPLSLSLYYTHIYAPQCNRIKRFGSNQPRWATGLSTRTNQQLPGSLVHKPAMTRSSDDNL